MFTYRYIYTNAIIPLLKYIKEMDTFGNIKIDSYHSSRPEFSLHIGDLSSDVDDYTLYCAFAKNYRSVRGAKGKTKWEWQ
jgi:hypothetical protein